MRHSVLRRRALLASAAAGVGAAIAPLPVFAQAARPSLSAEALRGGLFLISGAGGNVVVSRTPDGAVLVDGGSPAHSSELLDLVDSGADGADIVALFNTHWHLDHTGSNERLGELGVKIVAHENTRLWLGADFYVEWEDTRYRPRPRHALPTETFYDGASTSIGGDEIEYRHLPRAHTDGDIYVFFPRQNVLVVGDVLSVGRYPVLDYSTGGWIGGLTEASESLLAWIDDDTRIVPGDGPVQTKADLQAQRDMLVTVMGRLMQMMSKGMSADEMLAASVTREFDLRWGDPRLFVRNAYRGLWGHVYALDPRPI